MKQLWRHSKTLGAEIRIQGKCGSQAKPAHKRERGAVGEAVSLHNANAIVFDALQPAWLSQKARLKQD